MNTIQIRYFLTTARCLNFTEAAKQLFISQSALSQQISAMEKELNMQLFVRDKKKVHLTPAAIVLLRELPEYEKRYEDIITRAQYANEGNTGILKVGFLEGQSVDTEVLKGYVRFCRTYPEIAVDSTCRSFGGLQKMLAEDEVDIIYTVDFEVEDNHSYAYEIVADDSAVVVVSKFHPLAKQEITDLSQLRNETIIMLREKESPVLQECILADCRKHGFIPSMKYAATLDEQNLWIELGHGFGITNKDSFAFSNKNNVWMKNIKIAERKFVFCWKKSNVNPIIHQFVQYVQGKDMD